MGPYPLTPIGIPTNMSVKRLSDRRLEPANSTEVFQFRVSRGLVRIVIALGGQQKLAPILGGAYQPSDALGDVSRDGGLIALNHPEVGWRTHFGAPWSIQNRDSRLGAPAPLRGADTDSILSDLLGYSADRIAQLRESGVLT
jgi:hypothetical protein